MAVITGAMVDDAAAVVGSGVALAALGADVRLGLRAGGVVAGCCWSIMHPPQRGCAARTAEWARAPGEARGLQAVARARPVAGVAVLPAPHRAVVCDAAWVQSSARRETVLPVARGAIWSEVFAWSWVSSPCLGARPPLWCALQSSRKRCRSATIVEVPQTSARSGSKHATLRGGGDLPLVCLLRTEVSWPSLDSTD